MATEAYSVTPSRGWQPLQKVVAEFDKEVWQLQADETLAQFALTDLGNAEAFVYLYNDKVRYDHKKDRWLVWSEHTWKVDGDGEVSRMASDCTRLRQLAVAKHITGVKEKQTAVAWTMESESNYHHNAMINRVKDIKPVSNDGDGWDQKPWLLSCKNGIVDLTTGILRNGVPEDMITMNTGQNYNPAATCGNWLKFMGEVFSDDIEMPGFLHRWFGYNLTGVTQEDTWVILHGEKGRNGKRIMTDIVSGLLGDYGHIGDDDILIQNKQSSTGGPKQYLVDLSNKRCVVVSETERYSSFNLARIKGLTGSDTIAARGMFGKTGLQIKPTWKISLLTNNIPHLGDAQDDAFMKRTRIVRFTQRFVDEPKNPNEHPVDRKLIDKLRAESEGILAWLVQGTLEWQRVGLLPPESSKIAAAEYLHDEDTIGQFKDECLSQAEGESVYALTVYHKYVDWCAENGLKEVNNIIFSKRMKDWSTGKRRMTHGWLYEGIGLNHDS